MKIICCKCKKEYDLSSNIFGYDKANRPILICPHCGFKHLINFIPFEKDMKVKRINKLNLGGGPYFAILGASRIANATRVDQSIADDNEVESGQVNTASYASIYKNVTTQDTYPTDVAFNIDGSKMFIVGYDNHKIFEYALSTPWAINTASYTRSYDTNSETVEPTAIAWKPDGKRMYISELDDRRIQEYGIPKAWDLSIVNPGNEYYINETLSIWGVAFRPDGIKMYILGKAEKKVFQYTLSTAWYIAAGTTYDSVSLDVSGEEDQPYGMAFSPEGDKLYITGMENDSIQQYRLSTPWDLSTATFEMSKDVSGQNTMPFGLAFKTGDRNKMYIMGNSGDNVYQYSIKPDWTKANDFILAMRIYTSKGPVARAYKLRWRNVTDGGSFADVGSSGEITFNASTDLTDDGSLILGEKKCDAEGGYTWQNGLESEGDNISPDSGTYSLADEYYTEFQWALDCSGAKNGCKYEFELYDVTETTIIGTCQATIRIRNIVKLGATRIANSNRADQSGSDDGDVTNWTKTNDFIIATRIFTNAKDVNRRYKLRWRDVTDAGAFADVGPTGEINYNADTVLGNNGIVESGEAICSAQGGRSWQDGMESEGDNVLPGHGAIIIFTGKYTELQWALDCSNAEDSHEYEIQLYDEILDVAVGTCLATITMAAQAAKDATGKASITSSIIAILSRGKIEGATGKASITSSVISKLQRTINRTAKAEITTSVIIILKSGMIKNATGEASITTLLSAILARGKIEDATAKANIATNIDAILSRGKIENATGSSDITTLMQAILSNYINATAKASIDTNIDVTLDRGKIENATGKAAIISSVISILSRGKIESITGKSSITSNFESILSRGKIENVTGKASITSSIITILSRGKVENATGKTDIETSVIIILSSGAIKNATGKADISTNIDSQIRIIRKATAKSSMTSLIDITLSRGKIEGATGKANINSSIIIALSRGKIESVTGKASITSEMTAVLSRGQIESATGKASINTIITAILSRGKIENASGKADIISNLIAVLQKEAAINASGKASITTNIEAGIKRIIARAGKASLETSYNAILSRGEIIDVNGKAFIYTSINAKLLRIKRATGKANINSFINIPLKRLINASGKSIFDTLMEIEITREYAFSQATLGIIRNQTKLSIQETDTEMNIKRTETKLGIER